MRSARRWRQTGIVNPVAHTSYLINLASPDGDLWQKSIDAMVVEVEHCEMLGIADLVLHPVRTWARARKRAWHGSRWASTRSTGGRRARGVGSTWRRPPGRGRAWATSSSTSA